jgi:GTP-binding protein
VRLVDTAGLRKKAKVQEHLERLSTSDTIRAITFAEVVILVMDATQAFETQELQIADLVEREGRALVFCLTKWDLVEEPQARLKELRELADRVLPQVRGTPLVALSGETGRNVDRLMPAVIKTHANWSAKIKTRDLNDWLRLMVQRHPPPAVNGKRIKPKYMAQTKARPPTFVLLANRAEQMPESWRRYLVNGIRESFDLPGVPIRLIVRQGANPYAEGGEQAPARRLQSSSSAPRPKKAAPVPGTEPAAKVSKRPARKKPAPKPAHPGRVRARPVKNAPKPRGPRR